MSIRHILDPDECTVAAYAHEQQAEADKWRKVAEWLARRLSLYASPNGNSFRLNDNGESVVPQWLAAALAAVGEQS